MKIILRIEKAGVVVYEGRHEIKNAESFGHAFADAWSAVQERKMEGATSIGALMETMNDTLLEEFSHSEIIFDKT